MSLNPTVYSENGKTVPDPGQNVLDIRQFRKAVDPAEFTRKARWARISGRKPEATIIPFHEILSHKEKNDAVKRLQQRTGLGSKDARDVIETLQNKDIGHWEIKAARPPRSRRLLWFCLSFAAAGMIWLLRF